MREALLRSGVERSYDIVVIGSGVLGASLALLLSETLGAGVVVVEREAGPALHASGRNTGVIHRPFYLDPVRRRLSAWMARVSYSFWKRLAEEHGLPWGGWGTLEVAVGDEDLEVLERYLRWGVENGMDPEEMELLGAGEASRVEPEVRCRGALLVRTDVSTDFRSFTAKLVEMASSSGARFFWGLRAVRISEDDGAEVVAVDLEGRVFRIRSRLLINAAGGEAYWLARQLGLARDLSLLYFRGDYWELDPGAGLRISRNIYRVPRHRGFPFLDPHLVLRHDGKILAGPNAAPVLDPYAYKGVASSPSKALRTLLSRPWGPKIRLAASPEFASLALGEWRASLSKKAMASLIAAFAPRLRPQMLVRRISGGVRAQILGREGLAQEPILLRGRRSLHILNFNSPGATGAPAFSRHVLEEAERLGLFGGMARREPRLGVVASLLRTP